MSLTSINHQKYFYQCSFNSINQLLCWNQSHKILESILNSNYQLFCFNRQNSEILYKSINHLNKLKLEIELQKSTQLDLRGTWWSKSISVIALDNEAVANTNLFYLAKAPCEVRSFSKTTSKTTKVICNAWLRFHLLSRSKTCPGFCSIDKIDPEFLQHQKNVENIAVKLK